MDFNDENIRDNIKVALNNIFDGYIIERNVVTDEEKFRLASHIAINFIYDVADLMLMKSYANPVEAIITGNVEIIPEMSAISKILDEKITEASKNLNVSKDASFQELYDSVIKYIDYLIEPDSNDDFFILSGGEFEKVRQIMADLFIGNKNFFVEITTPLIQK